MTDTKKLIDMLKQVKQEKGLSLDAIMKLIEDNGDSVSKTTLSRVFSDNSDYTDFRYETTLRPICEALLDIEHIESDDTPDVRAFKTVLKMKRDIISELKQEMDQEKLSYHEKLQAETEKFQKSLDFVKNQILLKDQRIDALLTLTTDLMATNNKLVKQLMDCPIRKGDCE